MHWLSATLAMMLPNVLAQIIFHVTIQNKSLEFPESVPESLRSIGRQCMSKESSERPTMKEVVERLEAINLDDQPPAA